MRLISIFALFFGLQFTTTAFASPLPLIEELTPFVAAEKPAQLPNFQVVAEGQIYRGGQPSPEGLKILAERGVKVILDLRNEDPTLSQFEGALVQALGMKFVSVPMSAYTRPSDKDIDYIENTVFRNSVKEPVFVHCHLGEDRTGLVVGLYRVFVQTPPEAADAAYREMLMYGFKPILRPLANYFFDKTGYRPKKK